MSTRTTSLLYWTAWDYESSKAGNSCMIAYFIYIIPNDPCAILFSFCYVSRAARHSFTLNMVLLSLDDIVVQETDGHCKSNQGI